MLAPYLEEIGLSDKEAAIYLALLQYDTATPATIAEKTGIKRPTVYVVLQSLEKKGLASETEEGKTTHYRASPPERLETYVDGQKQQLEESSKRLKDLIPQIRAIQRETGERPIIRMAHGVEAALAHSSSFFDGAEPEPRGFFLFNQDLLDKHFPASALASVKKIRPSKKIGGQSLYTSTTKDLPSDALTERRKIDPKKYPILADISMYGDRIQMVTLGENVTTILLQSKDIATTFETLFRLAFAHLDQKKKEAQEVPPKR